MREATGEAAYAAGHYSEALAELRAAKRMNGATAYLPIMADCHRALGNAKRALELAKSPSVGGSRPRPKAEMTIVEAGARRDLGQFDAALRTLELSPINSKSREAWVVRLRYAYADTLEQAGREQDALSLVPPDQRDRRERSPTRPIGPRRWRSGSAEGGRTGQALLPSVVLLALSVLVVLRIGLLGSLAGGVLRLGRPPRPSPACDRRR